MLTLTGKPGNYHLHKTINYIILYCTVPYCTIAHTLYYKPNSMHFQISSVSPLVSFFPVQISIPDFTLHSIYGNPQSPPMSDSFTFFELS